MTHRRIVRILAAVLALVGLIGVAPPAQADDAARHPVTTPVRRQDPRLTDRQIARLARALSLDRRVIKRGLKQHPLIRVRSGSVGDLLTGTQLPSGPNALESDPALRIRTFTFFPGAPGEWVFLLQLKSPPTDATVEYQYSLGIAVDEQPQSVADPNAVDAFGRIPLTRMWTLAYPSVDVFANDPVAGFAPIPTDASGAYLDEFVAFRVLATELPAPGVLDGDTVLSFQAFGRRGSDADSPAGFFAVRHAIGPIE